MKKKKNNKNNKTLFFMFFAIILTIIALIATSGTYAKYTSSITTSKAEGTVAMWKVLVNDKNINASSENVTFNIFDTIKDESLIENEQDVAAGKIAPGTAGTCVFKIQNLSEVNITYSIEFKETNSSEIPIEYSISGDADDYYSAEKLTEELNNNSETIDMGATKNVKVYWRWAYEIDDDGTRDKDDTILGINAQETATLPKYEVSAKLIATQVD